MTDPESLRRVLNAGYEWGQYASRTRYQRVAVARPVTTAVPGATSVPAHRLDAALMTPPLCLAARSSARSPR